MTVPYKLTDHSQRLIDYLTHASEGGEEVLSYAQLSAAAGVDVTSQLGRNYLSTARRRVQEDCGDVWGTKRTQGVYLVPHNERARTHEGTATKVRGVVRRAKGVMVTVKTDELSSEAIESFNTGQTRIMLMGVAASRRTENRVRDAVKDEQVVIEPMRIIDALDLLRRSQAPPRS